MMNYKDEAPLEDII
jgi:ubiquitin-protein ligase E3 A